MYIAHLVKKITSNVLVTLVAAKEECFQKPLKTIEAVRRDYIILVLSSNTFV